MSCAKRTLSFIPFSPVVYYVLLCPSFLLSFTLKKPNGQGKDKREEKKRKQSKWQASETDEDSSRDQNQKKRRNKRSEPSMGNRISIRKRSGRRPVEERFTRPKRFIIEPANVDYKKLRKLILSEKLAPCFDGVEESNPDLEECPICFFVMGSSKNRIFFYGFWFLRIGFWWNCFGVLIFSTFRAWTGRNVAWKESALVRSSLFSPIWIVLFPYVLPFGLWFSCWIWLILFLFYLLLQNAFCRWSLRIRIGLFSIL